jgi:hypothetical protein
MEMVDTANIYQWVAGVDPTRTGHVISKQHTGSGELGIMYCNMAKLIMPGTKIKCSAEGLVRLNPQIAPLMHEIKLKYMHFFVPLRLLWKNEGLQQSIIDRHYGVNAWETFITGAIEGMEIEQYRKIYGEPLTQLPTLDHMKWNPNVWFDVNGTPVGGTQRGCDGPDPTANPPKLGGKWECLGWPSSQQIINQGPIDLTNQPLKFAKRAWNKVWNDWIRNENYVKEVNLDYDGMLAYNWERDRFTSANYQQQKGTTPDLARAGGAIPIWLSGSTNTQPYTATANNTQLTTPTGLGELTTGPVPTTGLIGGGGGNAMFAKMPLGNLDMNTLRLLAASQRALEHDMRCGSRYTEYLQSNYNASPKDERLQRAELIDIEETYLQMNDVVSTSGPQGQGSTLGNYAGYSKTYKQSGRGADYFSQEWGVYLCLWVAQPRTMYQQKLEREWLKDTRYDFYRPQFAYLSEQEILNREIYYTGITTQDMQVWGFNERWGEERTNENTVSGLMRNDHPQSMAFYHLGRYFTALPNLNSNFLQMSDVRKDYLNAITEPALMYTVGYNCYMEKPIPAKGEPGLLDHVYGESTKNKVRRGGIHLS